MPTIAGPEEIPQVELMLEGANEFVASEDLSPEMVAAVCREGFLPMGLRLPGLPLLLIKSHLQRYVLSFDDLHVPRNAVRYAKGLTIYRDHHFTKTLTATIDYHPDVWIIPELRRTFEELHRNPIDRVQTRSVEVYSGDRLVAGEVGYVVGSVYTSLSGFHLQNGAGTVQMVSLAGILIEEGATFWDVGMEAEYKTRLGAHPVERSLFRNLYRSAVTANAESTGVGSAPADGDATAATGADRRGVAAGTGNTPADDDATASPHAALPKAEAAASDRQRATLKEGRPCLPIVTELRRRERNTGPTDRHQKE
jgi:Leu/Phe-tRNA-protein transferase